MELVQQLPFKPFPFLCIAASAMFWGYRCGEVGLAFLSHQSKQPGIGLRAERIYGLMKDAGACSAMPKH